MYLDESGDHGLGPTIDETDLLCVAGIVLDDSNVTTLQRSWEDLKEAHFGDRHVVVTSRALRKAVGPFSILRNPEAQKPFLDNLRRFIRLAPISIITAVIRKKGLAEKYVNPWHPYFYGLVVLCERFAMFLGTRQRGRILAESRGPKEDKWLQKAFSDLTVGGTLHLPPSEVGRVTSIGCVPKQAAFVGCELADLAAHTIVVALRDQERTELWSEIWGKLRRSPGGKVKGWGLVWVPE